MRKQILTGIITGVLCCGVQAPAMADSFSLTGTIRDFSASHPDFETPLSVYGVYPGIVQSTLGIDGKPVWGNNAAAIAANHVSNQTNFDQWYRNVSGVNQSMPYAITLQEIGSTGVYEFYDTTFFPIDNLLGGNEGRSHNYHFTYEINTTFEYDASIERFFTFSGDDDVWVFINNQLVIDLGGVHMPATRSINLSSLGLVNGNTYDFDFFFAERHTYMSEFRITTNIPIGNPVPEPATMLLLGAGLVGVAGASLKRKK